jgi:hypothetical protein
VKFALLYHYDPATDGPSEGEIPEWFAFDKEVKDAGVYVYAEGFYAAETAKTVSARDGKATTEDGGVVGAGDVLAGLVVVDVADMAAALDWALRIPTATYGKVEVRPVVEWEG